MASRALVPSAADRSGLTITAYSPLSNASIFLDGQDRRSFSPSRVRDFKCSLETENYKSVTTVLISTEDANLYPPRLTMTYDPLTEDGNITLQMTVRDDCNGSDKYRWFDVLNSKEKIGMEADVMLTSEHFYNRSSIVLRHFFKQCKENAGFTQVLVRECPTGKWSPKDDCQMECSICLNGGMCHPETGQCICPPGFSGSQCQNVHGQNVFGQQGQYSCSLSEDPHDGGCQGQLFCLPEPFGCTCGAGYKGISCSEECEEGTYGANCEQRCHCQNSSTCRPDTGECDGSPCQEGWSGQNCQEMNLVIALTFDAVNINQTTNITCSVPYMYHYAAPRWNESDFLLLLPDGTEKDADFFIEDESSNTVEYIFRVVANSLSAVYSCTGVSVNASVTVSVTAFEPPWLSTQPTVFNSSSNTITLTWEAWGTQPSDRGEGPLVKYIITYLELGADGTGEGNITALEAPEDARSIVVQGLREATGYEFRVTAVRPGVGGAGPPSPPTAGNTTCAVAGPPTSLVVRPINASALRLSWSRPAGTGCPVITYRIRCELRKWTECPSTENKFIGYKQTRDYSLVVGSLLPYRLYRFKVRSETDAGVSSDMTNGKNTTSQSVPGPPVLLQSESTNTSLDFAWTEPDCADRNGVILGYHVQLLDRHGNPLLEGVTSPSETNFTFQSLDPCTDYQFHVRGWTSAGNGSFSNLLNVTTAEGVPDKVARLNIFAVNSTHLQVSWFPPLQAPCQILGYSLSYTLVQQGQCEPAESPETLTVSVLNSLVATVPGLLPYSEYAVVVRAMTAAGDGEGFTGIGRTLEGVPGHPVSVTAETTPHSLTFTWDPPVCAERNGLLTSYHASLWSATGTTEKRLVSSEAQVLFENVQACTNYSFEVGAETSVGPGLLTELPVTTDSELPDVVTDVQIYYTRRSLQLDWQPPTGTQCDILGYNLTYKLVKHLACDGNKDFDEELVTTENPHYVATDLSPYSHYLVSVAAMTSAGMGNWTHEYADTLQEEPGKPINVSLEEATSRSLSFTWEPPPCDKRNGLIIGYKYKFVETEGRSRIEENDTLPNVTMVSFDQLLPCTKYHFKVKAQTSVGGSGFTTALFDFTEEEVPNAVSNVSVTSDSNSILVTWKLPTDTNPCITGYLITHKLEGHLPCRENVVNSIEFNTTVGNSSSEHLIDRLSPASNYTVTISALTIYGGGEPVSRAIATEESVPAPPVSVSPTFTTSSSLGFTWQPPACNDSNGVIQAYHYRLTNMQTGAVRNETTGATVTMATFEGLPACTGYSFQVRAQTSAGYGMFSPALPSSTRGQAPNAVRNLVARPLATSLELTWIEPENASCDISHYLISFQLVRHLQCPQNETGTLLINETVNGTETRYDIPALSPASKYLVSIRAQTVSGFGEAESLEVNTLEAAPGNPINVRVEERMPRSLTFSWEPPPCNEKNGAISNYVCKLFKTPSTRRIEQEELLPNVTMVSFHKLLPCTQYHFKVKAKTSKGTGTFTDAHFEYTKGEVPNAVSEVSVTSNSSSVRVTWTPSADTNPCGITAYLITHKLERHLPCGEEVDSIEFNTTVGNSSREYRIDDLSPASNYTVTVSPLNVYGPGDLVSRAIATDESVPGPVSNVSVTSVGQFSASISWGAPSCEDSNGRIIQYVWQIKLDGSIDDTQSLTGTTTDTSVRVSNLTPCSTYTVTIQAETGAGVGHGSSSSPFTTMPAAPGKVGPPVVSSKASTFARVSWSSPVASDNPCAVQLYTVRYYLKKLRACPTKEVDEGLTVNTSNTQLDLTPLQPFSVYRLSLAALTEGGYGEVSDELRFDTNSSVPDQVTGVRLVNSSKDFLQFAWNELECEARHDKINGYEYEVRRPEDSSDDDSFSRVGETQLFALISHLDSCTEYQFRVRAVGKTSRGYWSKWEIAVTSTALPEQVQNLTLRHGDDPATQIQASWQPSPLDVCTVSTYQVGYLAWSLEECSLNTSSNNWTFISVKTLSAVLRGLQAYSQHNVSVRGETAAGLGREVFALLETSEDVPTGPPENISTSLIGTQEIRFHWKPPHCGQQNGLITGYNYTLLDERSNQTKASGHVLITEVLLSGLVPYVEYHFYVQANTAVGPGPDGHLFVRTEEGEPPPPRNFRVSNAERTFLELEWNPPHPPSGIISAYQILYWPSSLDETAAVTRGPLMDPTNPVHRYTITDLKPYTEYDIKIRAKTGAGHGEFSETITQRTAEGTPEMPARVMVLERTADAITVAWEEPENINGVLKEYKIEYRIVDQPFEPSSGDAPGSQVVQQIMVNKDITRHQIGNLESATGYEVRVAAKTVEFGDDATLPSVYTLIPAINSPERTEPPTVGDDNTVTLQLKPIDSKYISVYQVTVAKLQASRKRSAESPGNYRDSPNNYVAAEFDKTALPDTFRVGDNRTYGRYFNAALQPDTQYNIQFCGVGRTKQDTRTGCSDPMAVTTNPVGSFPMSSILGAIIAVLVVVALVVAAVVVIRKRRNSAKSAPGTNGMVLSDMEKAESRSNGLQNQAVAEEIVRSQLRRSGGVKGQSTTPAPKPVQGALPRKAWKPHKAVGLQDLPQYVKRKKANSNKGFVRDYASFPDEELYSCNVAQRDVNKNKNRYANIIPYDYSRVVLDPINDDPDTDYINASYVDGYRKKNAYIATQGHNKYSTPDFWRMVWQQEVAIIVMLTNLVENAKKKCAQYWPDNQLDYNSIIVKKVKERVEQDFTERVFVISNFDIEEDIPREVRQFHYTSWPDMGLPDSPAPLMNFIHEVKQMEENNMGPMVVHCSAGVGRTGTFITVDAMLNMVAEEKQINVIDFVYEMRKKRPKMVQTQDQYMFIFEVLLETLLCGDTVMSLSTFPVQYAALRDSNPLTSNSYVQEHLRVLDTMSVAPSEDNCYGGRNELNQDKNRFHDCIPLDKSRPYLMSPGEGGSTNYINASFIDAYKRKDGFLATQSPLPNTVVDFWRMVYDYNARVIVMLNQIDGSDETCAPYWIDDPEETAELGVFEVQLRDCKDFKHTIARTFKLKNTTKASEKPRTIHHFEFLQWSPEEETPASIVPFLCFMELVQQSHCQTGGDARIAVHCLDGVSRSGIFCTAMASLEKLKEEKVVDVFHAVRNLRRSRHNMVESQDQYLFCYEVLNTYLEENQTYANFR
ncbi:receptor-type tyrosine-protein phosphatase F-like isoform X2 [Acanthaster planci]|nr:receptor-type tyrosine-protein phosphatase F-like isoform X2 [Acanthaster planci]